MCNGCVTESGSLLGMERGVTRMGDPLAD
jgi:hypothetical protein